MPSNRFVFCFAFVVLMLTAACGQTRQPVFAPEDGGSGGGSGDPGDGGTLEDGGAPEDGGELDGGPQGEDGGTGPDGGCGAGLIFCFDQCHDPMTSRSACGGCNRPCGPTARCEQGTCVPACGGGATFQSVGPYALGVTPFAIEAADLDKDGVADLVVGADSAVAVLGGNGDGTFQSPATYGAGSSARALALADFDADGHVDAVVANFISTGHQVSFLGGVGDGTLEAPVASALGGAPVSMTHAELNGDGKPDLAVATSGSSVEILLGNGDGTFNRATPVTLSSSVRGIAAGDFDQDGKADLAVGLGMSAAILRGRGDGTFEPAATYGGVSGSIASLRPVDLNGDGALDLLSASFRSSFARHDGVGDGTFQYAYNVAAGAESAVAALGADFDADGWVDVMLVDRGPSGGNGAARLVLSANGTSYLGDLATPLGVSTAAGTVADFDGDGRPDFAAVNADGTATVLINSCP